ncbi:MAG: hypothetical protein NC200_06025 [Candidatus Gastranaerophilales bacterium]|nr:hypothetical protein [Candidatus Gastranaerophilales bacterium]
MPTLKGIASSLEHSHIKPYTLISKEKGIDASRIDLAERIGLQEAQTADVVVIAKTDNPEQKKIITTYRDKDNNPVETVLEFIGIEQPEVHRLYKELPNFGYQNLRGRLIQVFENLDITNKYKAWKKVLSEKQYVAKSGDEKTHVTISRVKTADRNLGETQNETHTLTEYAVPKAHGGQKIPPRYISMETVKDECGVPQIKSIHSSPDVEVPKEDQYLALRMYDAEDTKIPIARIALEEHGLKKLMIPIEKDNYSMKETTSGSFNHSKGILSFNYRDADKADVIDTGYHEARHAQQYAIMAVAGKLPDTQYSRKCVAMYNKPVTQLQKDLAEEYHQAHVNSVPADVDYAQYRWNKLEREAWDEGERGFDNYIQNGTELSAQFPHIPEQEL